MLRAAARVSRCRVVAALLLALSFMALAGACAPVRVAPGTAGAAVRVRLIHGGRAVAGATVTAVRSLGVAFREEQARAVADADGYAVLTLPPGAWFLRGDSAEPPLFGWYGSNPVTVRPGESLELVLPAVPAPPPPAVSAVPPGEEGIAGVVVGEEGPLAAGVALYLDAATLFRGPGYAEVQADAQGRFDLRLSPGRYWLVARRRSGPQAFGPLEVGDVFGFHPGNPVAVGRGERLEVQVPVVRVLRKSGWSAPSALRARVAGTIRDAAGRPLAGYRAFLHARPTLLGKPDFVSEPSGPDGAYAIWADREGTYYLGARAEIGRAREEREAVGAPAGLPDRAVAVRLDGRELPPVDIVVPAATDAP